MTFNVTLQLWRSFLCTSKNCTFAINFLVQSWLIGVCIVLYSSVPVLQSP
jgi:hypothetical protein